MGVMAQSELYEIISNHIKIIEKKISLSQNDDLTLKYLEALEKFAKLLNQIY